MTHYEVLGVTPDTPPAEVRRAYLRLAREHHPDRWANQPPARRRRAERRMRAVNVAWSVLSDPDRRRAYEVALGLAEPEVTDRQARPPSASAASTLFGTRHESWIEYWMHGVVDAFGLSSTWARVLVATSPITTFLASLLLFALGVFTGWAPLNAVGAILFCVFISVSLFLPIAAEARAQRQSERAEAAASAAAEAATTRARA